MLPCGGFAEGSEWNRKAAAATAAYNGGPHPARISAAFRKPFCPPRARQLETLQLCQEAPINFN